MIEENTHLLYKMYKALNWHVLLRTFHIHDVRKETTWSMFKLYWKGSFSCRMMKERSVSQITLCNTAPWVGKLSTFVSVLFIATKFWATKCFVAATYQKKITQIFHGSNVFSFFEIETVRLTTDESSCHFISFNGFLTRLKKEVKHSELLKTRIECLRNVTVYI